MFRFAALLSLILMSACARSEFRLDNPEGTLVRCEMSLRPSSNLQSSFDETIETSEPFVRTVGSVGDSSMTCEKKERDEASIALEIRVNGMRAAGARTNSIESPAEAEYSESPQK